jgi:hypothetical protein
MRQTPMLLTLALVLVACRSEDKVDTDTGEVSDEPVDADGDGSPEDEDCDDNDDRVYPGATEVCNGVDDDCNGDIDDAVGDTWYADEDGDGAGDPEVSAISCEGNEGYVAAATDCDDADAEVNPLADEYCDDIDNDCDGTIDEPESVDASRWYPDTDSDGFGVSEGATEACEAPSGFADNADDCDDAEAAVNPDADEVCDGIDNDCDGTIDNDDALDASTWYPDADADDYGNADYPATACAQPSGYVTDATDCNDAEATSNPGGFEVCDGIDNNCDGDVDEGVTSTWYLDADADGYGLDSATAEACDAPTTAYVATAGDCDDAEATANPGETEVCDGIDNNCDGDIDEGVETTWYLDADSDGYGLDTATAEACDAPTTAYVSTGGDCDDSEATANPAETEVCDGIDNNCDGDVDEGVESTWYLDVDGDGYGTDTSAQDACSAPTSAYVADGGDCDDADTDYNPGATLGCDGEDYDCDGAVDNDGDGDGYSDITCGGTDCDDSDATILPEPGGSCALGTSCEDLYSQGFTTDGAYTIDQDGYGAGADPIEVYCEQTFDGGGWMSVFNYMDPAGNTSTEAAAMHAALINNDDMDAPVEPDSTSASVYTSNLDLSAFTEIVYGWAASDTDDVTKYGTYSDGVGMVGHCYVDGYCGANVAVGSFDIYPTGTTGLTVYTGSSPTYPHVGLGYSGQIILWGYDRNTNYGPWANWYDTKSCCTSGNTADIETPGWRYVIYLR